MKILIWTSAMLLVLAQASALCASADPMPALPPAAQAVSDETLSAIRGKYVPPTAQDKTSPAGVLSAGGALEPLQQIAGAPQRAAALSPLAGLTPKSGTVTYFGVQMVSSWTQTGQNGTQGVSVGLNLGFDLAGGQVSVSKWSSSTNGGLSSTPSTGNVTGSVNSNFGAGVDQTIQVAGDGNTISNTATVAVNGSNDPVLVPTLNTCAQQCTITLAPSGAGVAITTPGGTVMQSIGPNGIVQSAQVSSNFNTITNQLGVNVHTTQTPAFNASSLLPVLQTLTGLP